jgi:hypothetical protein
MTKKEVLIKAGSVMMFAILCIAFFQFFYPYHLFIKEQLQLFLFTSEYFISYLSKPASLASYLGDFFTQFFYLRCGQRSDGVWQPVLRVGGACQRSVATGIWGSAHR